jgi:O-antigen/teichoic acid export membrane protein
VSKRTDSSGLGSLGNAALTAASLAVVSGFSAIIGIVIAREFGRTDETDGFFAAYGVFIVVVTAAQAFRVAVLPPLTRARAERRLAGTVAGFALALAVVGVPLLLVAWLAASPVATVLTGGGSEAAQEACADALAWIVPAAVCHLFIGLAASALAALDDYATAAAAYAGASAAGLALILARVDEDGVAALSWGMALSAVVALIALLAALAWRALHAAMPAGAARPTGRSLRYRLGLFVAAAAIPLALQLAYVVSLPFAGRLGSGAVTSFGYAYLAASTLVAVTAFSIGLVSSVPLTRAGLDREGVARHVVAATWASLTIVGAAVGVLGLIGASLVEAVLGDAYGDDVGTEVARLIVLFSAWIVVAVGVNVAFPLAFVARRLRALPWIALVALAAQVLAAWLGTALFDLDGLAVSLAVTTVLVLALLLAQLDALEPTARGIVGAALVMAALTCVAFLPPAVLLGGVAGAVVGLGLYVALIALLRPRGLRASWAYLRALR